jgi:hypothetical protein
MGWVLFNVKDLGVKVKLNNQLSSLMIALSENPDYQPEQFLYIRLTDLMN